MPDDEEARARFAEATIDAHGVIRWDTNGAVPPEECLLHWHRIGLAFDLDVSRTAREADLDRSLAAYRENARKRELPAETMAEMRNELGDGPIIDAVAGLRIR